MKMQERLTYLIGRMVDKTIAAAEKAELRDLLNNQDINVLADHGVSSWLDEQLPALVLAADDELVLRQVRSILSVDQTKVTAEETGFLADRDTPTVGTRPAHRVHFMRRWGWVAASVILLLCAGAYLWNNYKKNTQPAIIADTSGDILPGKEGAVLTLADGSQVVLDSLGNGVVAQQNGSQAVIKNGQLVYDVTDNTQTEVVYNTIRTPNGRQFSLLLPDGSRVWLNAASSLRYPTVFTGKERRVEIMGEAYFEVAKNAQMPFRVQVNHKALVEVLGTHFNVNAYDNERTINTTLLEGSVKVGLLDGKEQTTERSPGEKAPGSLVLKTGEQAQVSVKQDATNNDGVSGNIKLVKHADLEKVIAWKNGLFNFEGAKVDEVIRQLERWYDIEAIYTNGVPDIGFMGELDRHVSLSGVLSVLERSGLHCRAEGRKLYVSPAADK